MSSSVQSWMVQIVPRGRRGHGRDVHIYLACVVLNSEARVGQSGVVQEARTLAHPAFKVLVGGTDLVQLF